MGAYQPPVDQLLSLGDNLSDLREEWVDYLALGIGLEHVDDLIRLAVDEELFKSDSDGDEIWAPYHAWRVLGVLRAKAAIPALVGLLSSENEADYNYWLVDELPTIFSMIGPAAIPPLTTLLEAEDASEYSREDAGRSLVEIAQAHPEVREEVIATLGRVLERAEWQSRSFNGWLVSDLMDLKAKESAGVIERAYAGGFVDDSICGTWYDVWHQLKRKGEPPPKTEPLDRIGPLAFLEELIEAEDDEELFDDEEVFDPDPLPSPPGRWEPSGLKTPDQRKDRNKARQKLEKKVKGKKGKGGKR